jgi:hypothetical protein
MMKTPTASHLTALSRFSHITASPSTTSIKQGFSSSFNNHSPCSTPTLGMSATKPVRDTVNKRPFSTIFDPEETQQPTLYEVLVKQLYTIKVKPVNFGLDNMEKIYNLINNPMDRVSLNNNTKKILFNALVFSLNSTLIVYWERIIC